MRGRPRRRVPDRSPGPPGRLPRGGRGAATVLAMGLAGVLLLVGVATVWLAGLVAAHRRAQSAADLAALAAAAAVQQGHPACAAAGVVAAANAAEVSACRTTGDDVWVGVRVATSPLLGLQPTVLARAHAGPAP